MENALHFTSCSTTVQQSMQQLKVKSTGTRHSSSKNDFSIDTVTKPDPDGVNTAVQTVLDKASAIDKALSYPVTVMMNALTPCATFWRTTSPISKIDRAL